MVTIYDMGSGTWSEDERDDEGVGRGGCCRREPAPRDRRAALPRLQLVLLPVSASGPATRWRG